MYVYYRGLQSRLGEQHNRYQFATRASLLSDRLHHVRVERGLGSLSEVKLVRRDWIRVIVEVEGAFAHCAIKERPYHPLRAILE